jgi:hypothetical protein
MRIGHQGHPGPLKNSDCLITGDGWELPQKHIQRVTLFQVIEKILDWHTRSREDGCSALNVWVNGDEVAGHGKAPSAFMPNQFTTQRVFGAFHGNFNKDGL